MAHSLGKKCSDSKATKSDKNVPVVGVPLRLSLRI